MAKLADIFTAYTIDGNDYMVSTGTGERNYGAGLGGNAAFAYYAEDVTEWRENAAEGDGYAEFCEAVSPVESRELALALAAEGLRLTRAGSCSPVLTDDEFRQAVEATS